MNIIVKELPAAELTAFIDFPYRLFADHPFWVGELKSDTKKLLSSGHPFWRHAEAKLFMAFEETGAGPRSLGRIAAIINSRHNAFHNEKCGFFGFFDCEDNEQAAGALFEAACRWLKEKGMDLARGPVNPSTNETCGMLVEGFDSPPMIMMPYNPPYYAKLSEAAGFMKAKDLYAWRCPATADFPERLEKIAARATRGLDVSIEPVDIKNIDASMGELKEIYNSAWEKNWGFVPMTDEELNDMAAALKPVLRPGCLSFARVGGKAAGFSLLLPNLNTALRRARGSLNALNILPFLWSMKFSVTSGRLIALGVTGEFRNRGLEILLTRYSAAAAKKMGWEFGELSWTLEDNDSINTVIAAAGGVIYKKYRIYEKPL